MFTKETSVILPENAFLTIGIHLAKEARTQTFASHTRAAGQTVYKLRRQEIRLSCHGPVNCRLILRLFHRAFYTRADRYPGEAAAFCLPHE